MAEEKKSSVLRFPLGRNVFAEVHPDEEIIIRVSLSEDGWISAKGEGKNLTKATTGGNVMVPGTRMGKLNLTYYEPRD